MHSLQTSSGYQVRDTTSALTLVGSEIENRPCRYLSNRYYHLRSCGGRFPAVSLDVGWVMRTSPRDVTEATNCSLSLSSVTKVPATFHMPLVSGPLASSSNVIEAIFLCRDRVPMMYFLTMLFASSAFTICNLNQLRDCYRLLISPYYSLCPSC